MRRPHSEGPRIIPRYRYAGKLVRIETVLEAVRPQLRAMLVSDMARRVVNSISVDLDFEALELDCMHGGKRDG